MSKRADLVREAAAEAAGDAMWMRGLVALLREANKYDIYANLKSAEAGKAAFWVQFSLISRLVLLGTRAFADVRPGDRHTQVAFELLKDPAVRANIRARSGSRRLDDVCESWVRLRADSRLPKIKRFRDKEIAHLGERIPKLDRPILGHVFDFTSATAKAELELAAAVGVVFEDNPGQADYDAASAAFWRPWATPHGGAPPDRGSSRPPPDAGASPPVSR